MPVLFQQLYPALRRCFSDSGRFGLHLRHPPLRVPGLGRCLRIPFLRAAQHLRVLFPDEAGDFRNPADPAAGLRSGILHYWRAQCQQHAGQGKRCRLRKAYDCREIRLAQSQNLPFRADHRRLAADDSLFEHYFRFPLELSLFLVFAFVYPALALHCKRRRPDFGSPTEIPLCSPPWHSASWPPSGCVYSLGIRVRLRSFSSVPSSCEDKA